MGQVWRAYDTALDRQVAVKVLATELAADPEYRARFLREARAVTKLQHQNVVYAHDYGTIDGRLYLVMPLLVGQDLDTLIRRDGPLPLTRTAQVIGQAAAALDAAHRARLVHRDIKPSNIFVQPDGHVYLIDFGIAHTDGQDGLTIGTGAIGTHAYMAPERYDGKAGPEVDIYALTCVLFECLTGRRVFEGDRIVQQIAAHLTEPPPRPTELVPSLPAVLDGVIARGMAKDPADRYHTATALALALPAALRGGTAAMVALGDLLEKMDPPDFDDARRWYEQAAASGDTGAMVHLGNLLADRMDPPDLDGARHWYEQAAHEVEAVWSEILATVREHSKTVEVMLSGATVCRVDGNRIVLAHDAAALASRLAEPRTASLISDALRAVSGVKFEVTCVHSASPHEREKVSPSAETSALVAVTVGFSWTTHNTDEDVCIDAMALAVGTDRKAPSEYHLMYYSNRKSPDGAIEYCGEDLTDGSESEINDNEIINVDLASVPVSIDAIVFLLSIDNADAHGQSFGQVEDVCIRVIDRATGFELVRYELEHDVSTETALVLGEIYRQGTEWKFRAIGQGHPSGLAGIIRDHGISMG
ncbi:hypothetical protein CA951_02970 [Rhodococcus sp. NCIMB 12038]|nr:hypothetical protein CA951_02970 [Rhodococcus sp. NCIMB 12038]